MSFYFSSAFTECLDWVRDPYSSASVAGKDMTLQEQEELIELKQDPFRNYIINYMYYMYCVRP